MKKSSSEKIENLSFSQFKQQLDASRSYIVFENDRTISTDSILTRELSLYTYLRKENFKWQKVFDRNMRREYLIVQVEPGNEDTILGKMMGYPLPRAMVYYIFKANKE